jgi:hypothetical protein
LDEVDAFERLSTEGHDLEEMYEEIQQAFDLTGKDMGNRKAASVEVEVATGPGQKAPPKGKPLRRLGIRTSR